MKQDLKIKKDLLKFYPIEIESEYQKEAWISISHFYMFYYLFSYSMCVSVASYVSKEILSVLVLYLRP